MMNIFKTSFFTISLELPKLGIRVSRVLKVVKIQLLLASPQGPSRERPIDVISLLRLHNCKSFAGYLPSRRVNTLL